MAATKKAVTPATEKKTEAVKAEETKAVVKETAKAAEKAEAPKAEAKKEEPAKKAPAKKETVKKTATKKAELKSELNIQFSGKSYTEEDLVKIAKDVWKFDLKQKAGDLTSVELYVKPEEGKAYYVMNKEITGDFDI